MTEPSPRGDPAGSLAVLAHELRTPLAAIAGMADAMRTQALGPLPPPYEEYARLIHQTALHGLAVVGALGEAPASPQEAPAEAARTARDAIEAVRSRAQAKGVRLTLETACAAGARAPGRAMAQIVFNLVDNALRATAPGGAVDVRLDDDEGLLRLEVRDTGDGARAEPPRGAGLGLSIVRALCAAHGGEFQLQTTSAGAVARVWLAPARP